LPDLETTQLQSYSELNVQKKLKELSELVQFFQYLS